MSKSINSNSWSCVDGLGRILSNQDQVGPIKKDRYVAMFYWSCHGFWPEIRYARNITEVWNKADEKTKIEAKNDFDHPIWKTPNPSEDSWYWDEPIFGYYDTHDEYVIRKHAELLADAGVDLILFDCCVGLTTTNSYHTVFKVFEESLEDGVNAPKISFILPMGNPSQCRTFLMQLYDEIYSKDLYKSCWFYFENEQGDKKPLIFAWNDDLNPDIPEEANILNFFSYRRPDPYSWRNGDKWDRILVEDVNDSIRNNGTPDFVGTKDKIEWGWLNTYPQTKYYYKDNENLVLDNMPVSVAQNVDVIKYRPTAMNGFNPAGRNYTYGDYSYTCNCRGKETKINTDIDNSVFYGLNFQQQWDYAKESDPRFIFVTGWNEWTVGRYPNFIDVSNAFPDQFNTEYSRDVEPSAGILKDYYYYQLVENIRSFKGTEKTELLNVKKSIDIYGNVEQWNEVGSFDHYIRSTRKRDHNGCIGYVYKNNTMRNDILRAKVTYDSNFLYFYVETLEKLSDYTDKSWMRLFICTDLTQQLPNWEGFNYVINRLNPTDSKCFLEKSLGCSKNSHDWKWELIDGLPYRIEQNILQISVPRELLNMKEKTPEFHFKWSDNMQNEGDIMDFYVNGDVAPGGRFMFHFKG